VAGMKTHRRPVEIVYRSGYVLQTLGVLALFLAYDSARLDSILSVAGYFLIAAGVLISGWLLQVYMREVRIIVLVAAVAGIALQITGVVTGATHLVPLGLGFVFVGSCGLVGKEAYCFRFKEGWWLMPVLAVLTLALYIQHTVGHPTLAVQIVSAIALALFASFTIRKFKMPYYGGCGSEKE